MRVRPRAVRDRLDDRLSRREPGDASNECPCNEGLRPESKDHAVSGRRLRWPGSVNHAVIIDGVGRRNFDSAERRVVRSWLPGDDRFDLIVGKDRVNVETTAKEEGFASQELRNLRQI